MDTRLGKRGSEMKNFQVGVIYCTRFGHTAAQAQAVRRGVLRVPGAEVEIFTTEAAIKNGEFLDRCAALIFGTPTYMGSLASPMKAFMEASAGRWSSRAWSGKVAGGFTNSCNFSGDKLSTLYSLVTFAMQLGMLWVGVDDLPPESPDGRGPGEEAVNRNGAGIGPMASTFGLRGENPLTRGDLVCAENYGERVAGFAARL